MLRVGEIRLGGEKVNQQMANTSSQQTQGGNLDKTERLHYSEAILPGEILQLPEDLFLVVAAFLAISDISRLGQTCSYANQLCTSNFL